MCLRKNFANLQPQVKSTPLYASYFRLSPYDATQPFMRCTGLWLLCAVCFFTLCFKAQATPIAQQPVLSRTYKEWQQTGLHQGSVLFYPTLKLEGYYTDNVRAAPVNHTSDAVSTITPSLYLQTDRRDRGFTALAEAQQIFYAHMTAENNTNALLRVSPYYKINHSLLFKADLGYQHQHELRSGDNSNPLAKEPTPYDLFSGVLSLLYDPGRVGGELFYRHDYYSFGNVALLNGSGNFINDDRDRHSDTAGLEIFHDLSHLTRIGWRNELYRQNYVRADYDAGLYQGAMRDVDGWRSQMTFNLQPTTLLQIIGATGTEGRSFDDPRWSGRQALIGSLSATYMMTPLTNLILEADRFVGDTAFDDAAAFTQTHGKATIAHELKRNIIVKLGGGYGEADYWENDRQDDLYDGTLNVTYKQNQTIHWQAGYRYQKRESSVDAVSYNENIVSLGAKVLF